MHKTDRILLSIAGSFSFGIGAYHFVLPYQWHWGKYTSELPGIIEWGLYAINSYLSFFFVLLGIFTWRTIYLVKKRNSRDTNVLLISAIFWAYTFFYQLFVPVPIPQRLWFIQWAFLGAAFLTTVFYIIPLWRLRRHKV